MNTTFVLIPGAGGAAWYWHRVVAELERRGREAVAVQLPAADESAGLAEYTETVVQVIGDRRRIVLVAQSMGGFTAPLVCERVPVDLLVLVNAMVPRPGETGHEWWTATGWEAEVGDLDFEEAFFHDVPADVMEEAQSEEPPQAGTPFDEPWPLGSWPDVPTRFVQGRDDRFFPLAFQRRVVRERLGLELDEVPGGHLAALSRPVELVDALERLARQVGL
jgi:pimeloyl-ACP methyl ester carboxylesterase